MRRGFRFFFSADNDLLEEVAKFRAARRIWARLMKERFQAQNERSCQMRFHAQTAGSRLTAQQSQLNISRVTLQALAAVLGGTQSLHTNAWDEALALPTEASALLALRTQQIIGFESGVTKIVDPLGGSYYIESITDEIERQAQVYLDKIHNLGGMLPAIETGYVQKEIQDSAYRSARAQEEREEVVVGVNAFRTGEQPIGGILTVDPATEQQQIQKVQTLRRKRDSKKVSDALKEIEQALIHESNIMQPLLGALNVYATLGEVSDLLRKHFGEYKETATL